VKTIDDFEVSNAGKICHEKAHTNAFLPKAQDHAFFW